MLVLRDNGRGRGWPRRRSVWWEAIVFLSSAFLPAISCKGLSGTDAGLPRASHTRTADHSECHFTLPNQNSTLLGGIESGTFIKIGRVKSQEICGITCCQDKTCDVAFTVDDVCYNVQCYSYKLCRLKTAGPSKYHTAVMYPRRSDGSLRLQAKKIKKINFNSPKHKTSGKGKNMFNVKENVSGNFVNGNDSENRTTNSSFDSRSKVQRVHNSNEELKGDKLKHQKHIAVVLETSYSGSGHDVEDAPNNKFDASFFTGGISTLNEVNNTKAQHSSIPLSLHRTQLDKFMQTNHSKSTILKTSNRRNNNTYAIHAANLTEQEKPLNKTTKTNHSAKPIQNSKGKTNRISVVPSVKETHFWKDNHNSAQTALLLNNEGLDIKTSGKKNFKLALKDDGGKETTTSLSSVESLLENRNEESNSEGGLLGVRFDSHDSSCLAKSILRNVTLRNGLKAGEFTDYGKVKDVETCIRFCCEEKGCDVSLMLRKTCYTIHCHSDASCGVIPAHTSKLDPVLAFVSRTKNALKRAEVKRNNPLHRSKITLESVQKFLRGPKCRYKDIKHDVTLRHGRMAGEFKTRGVISDIKICIGLCCSDPVCDAAFIAGEYCYSVACYSRELCTPVKAHASEHIKSQFALIDRAVFMDEDGQKRQSIPGTSGGIASPDIKYTVDFNITSVVFTKSLEDFESLEFLNFAEKIQIGVSTLYTKAQLTGFKKCEVQSFRPSPLIVSMILTVEGGTKVEEVLKIILKAIKEKKLVSSIDGNIETYKLDPLGFQFITPDKTDLVCGAGHDYDVTWGLTMFSNHDYQLCPRGAAGQVKRQCQGSPTSNATWDIPNFSECVSSEYKSLQAKSKQFAEGAEKKVPIAELKAKTGTSPTEILKRLQELALQDTFREEILKAKQQALEIGQRKSKLFHTKAVDGKIINKMHNGAIILNETSEKDNAVGQTGKPNLLHRTKQPEDIKVIDYNITGRHHIAKPYGDARTPTPKHIATNQRLNPNFGKLFHYTAQKHVSLKEHHISGVAHSQPLKQVKNPGVNALWHTADRTSPPKGNVQIKDKSNTPYPGSSVNNYIRSKIYGTPAGNKPLGPWGGGSRTQYGYGANPGRPPGSVQGPNVRNGFPGAMINLQMPQNRQFSNRLVQSFDATKPNIPYVSQLNSPPPPPPPGVQGSYTTVWQNKMREMGQNQYGPQQIKNNYGTAFSPQGSSSVYANQPFDIGKKRPRRSHYELEYNKPSKTLVRVKRDNELLDDDKDDDYEKGIDSVDKYNRKASSEGKVTNRRSKNDLTFYFRKRKRRTHIDGASELSRQYSSKLLKRVKQSDIKGEGYDPQTTNQTFNYNRTSKQISAKSNSNITKSVSHQNEMSASTAHDLSSASGETSASGSLDSSVRTLIRKKRQNSVWYNSRVIPSHNAPNPGVSPYSQFRGSIPGPQQTAPFLSNVRTSYDNEAQLPSQLAGAGTYDVTYTHPPPTVQTLQEGNAPLEPFHGPFGGPQEGGPYRQINDKPNMIGSKGRQFGNMGTFKRPLTTALKYPATWETLKTTPSGPLNSVQNIPATLRPPESGEQSSSSLTPLSYKKQNEMRQNKTKGMIKQSKNNNKDNVQNQQHPQNPMGSNRNNDATLDKIKLPSNVQNISKDNLLGKTNPGPKYHHAVLQDKKNATINNFNEMAHNYPDTSISALTKKLTAMSQRNVTKSMDSFVLNATLDASGPFATAPSPFAPVLPKTHRLTHVAPMFGGDLLLAADVLKFLSAFNELAKPAITIDNFKNFINTGSHIMDVNNQQEWKNAEKHIERLRDKGMNVLEDVNTWDWDHSQTLDSLESESTGPTVVLELVRSIESYAAKASYRLAESDLKKPFITRNILMNIKVLDPTKLDANQPIVFPNYSEPQIAKWSNKSDSLTLSPAIFNSGLQTRTNQKIHLISSRYRTVADLLAQKNDSSKASTGSGASSEKVMSSQMITTTALPSPGEKLDPPVRIVLTLNKENVARVPQQCVFWKTGTKSGRGAGGEWSGEGCKLTLSNLTHSVCECSHLTSFALLANPSKAEAGSPRMIAPTKPPEPAKGGLNILNILLGLFFILLLVLITLIVIFFVWRRKKQQQQQEGSDRSREGVVVDAGAVGPGARPKSRARSRSGGREAEKSPATSPRDDTIDKSAGTEFEEMMAARRRAVAQDKVDQKPQKKGDDGLLMKEKAIIYSEYRQPYNFMAHEKPSPSPRTRRRHDAHAQSEESGAAEPSRDERERASSSGRPQPKPRRPRRPDQQ